MAERFGLPYTYGDKLRYLGEHVAIAATDLDHTSAAKAGQSYMYVVR